MGKIFFLGLDTAVVCDILKVAMEQSMEMGKLIEVAIERLRRCPIQLRSVRKESLDYIMTKEAIRKVGLIHPLIVRPMGDWYEVVDGNHRYEILVDLNVKGVIPCVLRDLTDEEIEPFQIMANATGIETRPEDYYRRLYRMVRHHQVTVNEIAAKVGKHPQWVEKILSLNYLSVNCKDALDTGKISCTLGIELAKLPVGTQDRLLELRGMVPGKEYLELVRQDVRHYRQGRKDSRLGDRSEVGPNPRIRKELLNEYLNPTVAASILEMKGAETPLDGWKAHSEWTMSMDPPTLQERRARKKRQMEQDARNLRLIESELLEKNPHE